MNKSAILHIPMSRYAFPISENSFVVRLRTAKGDLDTEAAKQGIKESEAKIDEIIAKYLQKNNSTT